MYRDHGSLVLSPTDLTKFLACAHLTALDLAVADGRQAKPTGDVDESLELLFRKGLEHEHRYLDQLHAVHQVIDVDQTVLSQAAVDTERAMRAGAEVIYQATFLHEGRRGHADFLLKTARPSRLGAWSYDVADTKLARRLKVPALLQMAEYGEHLERIQGVPPVLLTVVAGDGVAHTYPYADVESYYRRVTGRFAEFVVAAPSTLAVPVLHCAQCRWEPQCETRWRATDDLALVAFMRGDHREALRAAGITTLAELGARTADDLPVSIGRASRERLSQQARLQLLERTTGRPHYELLPAGPTHGLLRLPTPDPADLYLDFEGDPWVEPAGREYLAGIGDRRGGFTALWAHDFDAERQLVEDLIDRLLAAWQANPGMHVYHYAPYEKSALQRLTSRHGVREAELDVLLRAEVLVDLYTVVRQGLRISKESYSIKKLEAFYWGHTRGADGGPDGGAADVEDALASVVAYERWLVEGGETILAQIQAYNADDVRSTLALHDWLEERRSELAQRTELAEGDALPQNGDGEAGPDLPRPVLGSDAATAQAGDAEQAEAELAEQVHGAGLPLLAGLVGWHRREQRPAWWDMYRLEELDEDELVEDGSALGALGEPVYVGDVKRSHVHRYEFPPQDTRVRLDDPALDVDTHESAGKVVGLDAEQGWIELSVAKKRDAPRPRGVGPKGPVNDQVLRDSIADTARRTLAGEDVLGARLVRRVVPAGLPVRADETPAQAVVRIGRSLDGAVLAVQGPPGTGKSTAGAELIRALLDAGLKVGITALSHQVIGNLLSKVDRPGLQRCDEDAHCGHAAVEWTGDNDRVVAALADGSHNLVGGTSWLWSRPDLASAVDVLIVDEAGQFSLANAVAASRAAHSMVLLGDPQQLSQPTQADHPYGAGVSALEHLLGGHATVPPDQGVFLDTTWRMHPAVTEFVSLTSYESRLSAADSLERQAVVGGRWAGSGLRWWPVEHAGNESASAEEAEAVNQIVRELLSNTWVDAAGVEKPITAADILVVAPYNAHVGLLQQSVDPDVRVGTVDKFQGREAAVVIYSLASSSAADAPRGVDFLYDIHRLNVAVSRARAMTILVGSPRLLDAEVHSPHQLRQVNALCRYVELAHSGSR